MEKQLGIAALTENKAHITACEMNWVRSEKLKYNLEKQGVTSAYIMQVDSRNIDDFLSYDSILLDSPCSGSGTMSIFDAGFNKELIERSSRTQEELLRKALKILKHGGEMIYSTCSILTQENEEILRKIVQKSDAEIIPIEPLDGIPTLPTVIDGTLCVGPTELYEGFFVARIKKR